jgi:hypothetical protein
VTENKIWIELLYILGGGRRSHCNQVEYTGRVDPACHDHGAVSVHSGVNALIQERVEKSTVLIVPLSRTKMIVIGKLPANAHAVARLHAIEGPGRLIGIALAECASNVKW